MFWDRWFLKCVTNFEDLNTVLPFKEDFLNQDKEKIQPNTYQTQLKDNPEKELKTKKKKNSSSFGREKRQQKYNPQHERNVSVEMSPEKKRKEIEPKADYRDSIEMPEWMESQLKKTDALDIYDIFSESEENENKILIQIPKIQHRDSTDLPRNRHLKINQHDYLFPLPQDPILQFSKVKKNFFFVSPKLKYFVVPERSE